MPANPLTVHNAEVRTATVEIRTLTITGKQITLAVFRQLWNENLILNDGTLAGRPWGIVNYHPDKCADQPGHLHVVWQSGTDIRRATHYPPRAGWMHSATGDALIQALFCENDHRRPEWPDLIDDQFQSRYDFKAGGLRWKADDPASHRRSVYNDTQPCPDLRVADLLAQVNVEAAEEIRRRERALQSWQTLIGLPQLFIAV